MGRAEEEGAEGVEMARLRAPPSEEEEAGRHAAEELEAPLPLWLAESWEAQCSESGCVFVGGGRAGGVCTCCCC